MWRDVGYLVTETHTTNSMKDIVTTETQRKVFCNKKSIRQTEFYQAAATALRPELMFEVRTADYSDEAKFKFGAKTYNIIRTYDKDGEITELVCSGLVNK